MEAAAKLCGVKFHEPGWRELLGQSARTRR
jgi:hypothetical protein